VVQIADKHSIHFANSPTAYYDVVIIGGGMVGATTACALAKTGLNIAIVDSREEVHQGKFNFDGRASAIAWGSSRIWDSIGVWAKMQPVIPLHTIIVTDEDYPLSLPLQKSDMLAPLSAPDSALGFVVENAVSQAALWQAIRQCTNISPIKASLVSLSQPRSAAQPLALVLKTNAGETINLHTKLLVGADGAKSTVRQMAGISATHKYYDQNCLVFTLRLRRPHQNIAYERFQPAGPFAILPCASDRLCIVWTATKAETPYLLSLSREAFTRAVQEQMGAEVARQLGEFDLESDRPQVYQPQWQHSHRYIAQRIVLVGDSAHTTHPVAGQGVNLGIRDAGKLWQVISSAVQKGEDWGSLDVLARYQAQRYWDNLGTILATDLTNLLFSNQLLPWQVLRRFGLHLFHQVSPLRQLLMYLAMGLHSLPYNPAQASRQEDAIHSLL
jgi:2-octaprenyl-6-methoxyphenol hydroxylase